MEAPSSLARAVAPTASATPTPTRPVKAAPPSGPGPGRATRATGVPPARTTGTKCPGRTPDRDLSDRDPSDRNLSDRDPSDRDLSERVEPDAAASERAGADRIALWQQRLLEAELGMTRYLLDRHANLRLLEWLHTQAEIFAAFPAPDDPDPAAWQRVFFRAQALMERFIVSRWGEAELADWAEANAGVFGLIEPDPTGRPADVVLRLARQADLYSSRYELRLDDPDRAILEISHCGIWDYRERARARGVPLTLDSPCTFCTSALSANIAAKGYRPAFRLLHDPPPAASPPPMDRGCVWTATDPQAADLHAVDLHAVDLHAVDLHAVDRTTVAPPAEGTPTFPRAETSA